MECSSLTGESELVPASVVAKHEIPAEARNVVFMSTLAMNGEGRGIVIRTGARFTVVVLPGVTWCLKATRLLAGVYILP